LYRPGLGACRKSSLLLPRGAAPHPAVHRLTRTGGAAHPRRVARRSAALPAAVVRLRLRVLLDFGHETAALPPVWLHRPCPPRCRRVAVDARRTHDRLRATGLYQGSRDPLPRAAPGCRALAAERPELQRLPRRADAEP